MTAPLKLDVDGPTESRATVTFKNWNSEYGLLISKDKLEQDAKNFRRIAKLLNMAASDEHATLSVWMMTLAEQFLNASCGYDPQAQETPYDKPPEMVAPKAEQT